MCCCDYLLIAATCDAAPEPTVPGVALAPARAQGDAERVPIRLFGWINRALGHRRAQGAESHHS
jgi:hypothetical protein